jgi:hydrogenase maturation protease
MKTRRVLIGLGNPIMSDDGVGIVVSRKVHTRLSGFELETSGGNGFDVIDRMLNCDTAVIIDSMVTGLHPPGTVAKLEAGSDLRTLRMTHSHGVDFLTAMEMAKSMGARLPGEIVVYGIEVQDPFSLGQEISQAVVGRIDEVVDSIVEDLSQTGR